MKYISLYKLQFYRKLLSYDLSVCFESLEEPL